MGQTELQAFLISSLPWFLDLLLKAKHMKAGDKGMLQGNKHILLTLRDRAKRERESGMRLKESLMWDITGQSVGI
jgi:hypothetical protein